jgi:glutathionylspermidine synthase
MENIKMHTRTGQIYYGNKCLHKDGKGYYTIGTITFGSNKRKIQTRQDITDLTEIERLDKFCNN